MFLEIHLQPFDRLEIIWFFFAVGCLWMALGMSFLSLFPHTWKVWQLSVCLFQGLGGKKGNIPPLSLPHLFALSLFMLLSPNILGWPFLKYPWFSPIGSSQVDLSGSALPKAGPVWDGGGWRGVISPPASSLSGMLHSFWLRGEVV